MTFLGSSCPISLAFLQISKTLSFKLLGIALSFTHPRDIIPDDVSWFAELICINTEGGNLEGKVIMHALNQKIRWFDNCSIIPSWDLLFILDGGGQHLPKDLRNNVKFL